MDLSALIGREATETDTLTRARLHLLARTLDMPTPDKDVPPLWHWAAFPPDGATEDLRPDGHPKSTQLLPALHWPRRMWAGGRLVFHVPVPADAAIERHSRVIRAEEKTGRAGPMALLTVGSEVRADGVLCIEEEQDVMYLPLPAQYAPPPAAPAPEQRDFEMSRAVSPALLFRFSACTFNAHRIHYDRRYATETEKYPGLVVHGPLQAILALEAARAHAPTRVAARFEFRGVHPLFDFDELRIIGRETPDGMDLFTANGAGVVTMQAHVAWAATSCAC